MRPSEPQVLAELDRLYQEAVEAFEGAFVEAFTAAVLAGRVALDERSTWRALYDAEPRWTLEALGWGCE